MESESKSVFDVVISTVGMGERSKPSGGVGVLSYVVGAVAAHSVSVTNVSDVDIPHLASSSTSTSLTSHLLSFFENCVPLCRCLDLFLHQNNRKSDLVRDSLS